MNFEILSKSVFQSSIITYQSSNEQIH